MARRRGDGPPGFIDRVRWGNVGRLAAVLAAGLLIAVGPGACGKDAAKPVAQPRGLTPDPGAVGGQYGSGSGAETASGGTEGGAGREPREKPKRHNPKRRKPKAAGRPRLVKRSTPTTAPTYRRRVPATGSTRRYYSAPRRSYVPPPAHYTPAPEPPRGAPEFL